MKRFSLLLISVGLIVAYAMQACYPELLGYELDWDTDITTCQAPCTVNVQLNKSTNLKDFVWVLNDDSVISTADEPAILFEEAGTYRLRLKEVKITDDTPVDVADLGKEVTLTISPRPVVPIITIDTSYTNLNGAATDLVQLADGGYLLVGYGQEIIKLDSTGEIQTTFLDWPTQAGTSPNTGANFYEVIQLPSGDFVMAENVPQSFPDRIGGGIVLMDQEGVFKDRDFLAEMTGGSNMTGSITDLVLGENGRYYFTGSYVDMATANAGLFLGTGVNRARPEILATTNNGTIPLEGGKLAVTANDNVYFSGLEGTVGLYLWNGTGLSVNLTSLQEYFLPIALQGDGTFQVLEAHPEDPEKSELKYYQLTSSYGFEGPVVSIVKASDQNYQHTHATQMITTVDGGFAGVCNLYNSDIDLATGFYFIGKNKGVEVLEDNGGGETTQDFLYSIIQTRDGGFAMVGSRNGKFYFKKTDKDGL